MNRGVLWWKLTVDHEGTKEICALTLHDVTVAEIRNFLDT